MEVRRYVEVLRRRVGFILAAVVLTALAAGVVSSLRPSQYKATARVFLQPDNPAEQLNPAQASFRDPSRFVQSQVDIIQSEAVAQQAASGLRRVTAKQVEERLAVDGSSTSDVLKISATDSNAVRARNIANAVANGYIQNRRQQATSGLEQASNDLEAKLAPLRATIADLNTKIAAATAAKAASSPGPDTADAEALKASHDSAVAQYQTLYARQQELAVNISLQRGGAEIIAEAKTPQSPISPRPLRDGAAGALVGLVVGVGVVLLREQLDDKVRSIGDVQRTLGLPVLAQLPFDEESAEKPDEVATISRPHGSLSEAVRTLRTSIRYSGLDSPVRTIVVTSAVPSEGKSVVSANLAAACAQAGRRTILVGADLRRAGVSRLFGVAASSPGLTDAVLGLSGRDTNGSAPAGDTLEASQRAIWANGILPLLRKPLRNLAFLPSGRPPPNPSELLGSGRMGQVLSEVSAEADVVIIDTPPLLPVTDAAILAGQVDGVILVLAINETRQEAAMQAKAILERTQARILGVVVNKASKSAVPYAYDGYYGEPTTNGPEPGAEAASTPTTSSWRRGTKSRA